MNLQPPKARSFIGRCKDVLKRPFQSPSLGQSSLVSSPHPSLPNNDSGDNQTSQYQDNTLVLPDQDQLKNPNDYTAPSATASGVKPVMTHPQPTQPQPIQPVAPSLIVTTNHSLPNTRFPYSTSTLVFPTNSGAQAQAPGQTGLGRPTTPISASSPFRGGSDTAPRALGDDEEPSVIWSGLKVFARALAPCGNYFGPLEPAISTFLGSVTILEEVVEITNEYKHLRHNLDWLFHDLAGSFGKEIPPGMRPSIINLAIGLDREIDFVRQKANQNTATRFLNVRNKVDEVVKCYQRMQTCLERLALNANVSIWMLVDEPATVGRLDKLNPAHPAWYSSAESKNLYRDECTPDTRVEALERFQVWRDDDKGEKIYWLNGMAGTGKTTLSYTLCKTLEDTSRLGANFFCSRQLTECRDVNRIIPTIAYQLAKFSYPFRYALSRALQKEPDLGKRRISEQYRKLLFEPLSEVVTSLPPDLVVVIEGLDECEDDNTVGEMLGMLFDYAPQLPIRFFLTSRPEPMIRERMLYRTGPREKFELHLHELDRAIVGDDIKKYLRAGLKRANVTEDQLDVLAERSGVLFIYAATVVRYVGAFNFTRSITRLAAVLKSSTTANGNEKEINALYTLILTEAFEANLDDNEKEEIRLVLNTVICAEEPLTVSTIAGLLGLSLDGADAALSPLRSVLNIEKTGEGITTLHKSFPDYLLDSERSGKFHCDLNAHNEYLVRRSFELMKEPDPPFNICELELSCRPDTDVPRFSDKVKEHISEHLVYACRYWFTHLEHITQPPENLYGEMHDVLSTRLLLWMEVMNLTGRLKKGVELLNDLKTKTELRELAAETRELVKDAHEFADTYLSSPASRSTPHIYILTLPFWPKQRPVSRYYSERVRRFMNPARRSA